MSEEKGQAGGNQLCLTDVLARQRTVLANERTMLAYVRTALTLIVSGVSFIQFFSLVPVQIAGWVFLPLGGLTLALGAWRYRLMRRSLR